MSDAAGWSRIEAALDELLALPQAQRAEALARLAGDDAAMRAELEGLLAETRAADSLLDRPAIAAWQPEPQPEGSLAPGARLGAWRIAGLIGRGGMGEVYRAERADGQFEQQVALKLIRRDAAGEPRRFTAERQILARLEHPGIARLLDGGVAEDGRPYMVMELVAGGSITEWCRGHESTLEQRLRLFMAVCEAVAYAHRNLVIHRDLKPGNVMVTAAGEVKLLDFGIAKLLDAGGAVDAEQTRHVPLTLGYAAPEQLAGGAVTTAADVYALGMLLYELLSGRRPWSLSELSMPAALDKLLREPPPPPSRGAAQGGAPPVPPRLLRGDLDAIVAKALRKEPEKRYTTVEALREDVARHLTGEAVAAREGARLYAASRFLRRNWLATAAAAAVLLAIVGGSVGVAWQARRAEYEARKATAVKDFVVGIFQANGTENPDGAKARTTTAEQLLDLGAKRIHSEMQDVPQVRAELLGTIGGLYANLDLSERAMLLFQEQVDTLIGEFGDLPNSITAAAEVQLGRSQVVSGHYKEADATLNKALVQLDALNDRNSQVRARALYWLAHVAFQTKPIADPTAQTLASDSLRILESNHPEDDLRITDLIELARINARRGAYAEAEKHFKEALLLEASPKFHSLPSDIAGIHLEYGEMLRRARRYDDSEKELRIAVNLFLQQVGPDYAPTLRAQEQLGVAFLESGRLIEAKSILSRTLSSFERIRGPDDLEWTADARIVYAKLLLARGELEAANAVIRQSVASLRAHGPGSVYFPIARRIEADVLIAQGQWREAEPSAADAQSGIGKFYGEKHERYAGSILTQADLQFAQGNVDKAGPLYQKVLEGWPRSDEPIPDPYVYATLGISRVQLADGQSSAAVKAAQSVLDKIVASPHKDTLLIQEAAAQLQLGLALTQTRRPTLALPHLLRATELHQEMDADQSPWLAQARVALAECYADLGEQDSAKALLAKASSAFKARAQVSPQFTKSYRDAQKRLLAAKAGAPT